MCACVRACVACACLCLSVSLRVCMYVCFRVCGGGGGGVRVGVVGRVDAVATAARVPVQVTKQAVRVGAGEDYRSSVSCLLRLTSISDFLATPACRVLTAGRPGNRQWRVKARTSHLTITHLLVLALVCFSLESSKLYVCGF